MHPAYDQLEDYSNYPNASSVLGNVFFVGCSPVITSEMIEFIDQVITKYIDSIEQWVVILSKLFLGLSILDSTLESDLYKTS